MRKRKTQSRKLIMALRHGDLIEIEGGYKYTPFKPYNDDIFAFEWIEQKTSDPYTLINIVVEAIDEYYK